MQRSHLEWEHTPGNLRRPWVTTCGQYAVYTSAGGKGGPVYVAGYQPVLGGLYYIGEPRQNEAASKDDCEHDCARRVREAA